MSKWLSDLCKKGTKFQVTSLGILHLIPSQQGHSEFTPHPPPDTVFPLGTLKNIINLSFLISEPLVHKLDGVCTMRIAP